MHKKKRLQHAVKWMVLIAFVILFSQTNGYALLLDFNSEYKLTQTTTPGGLFGEKNSPYEIEKNRTQNSDRVSGIYLNERGQVLWNRISASPSNILLSSHIFLYDNGVVTNIGKEKSDIAFSNGFNNTGEVLCSFYNKTENAFDSYIWRNGHYQLLDKLPNETIELISINDFGAAIGARKIGTETFDPIIFYKSERILLEKTLQSTDYIPYIISNIGQIVGSHGMGFNQQNAFFWEEGKMTDLGSLGGGITSAYALNHQGQVVGYSRISANGNFHAFLWENGHIKDLSVGEKDSLAFKINEIGEIIGLTGDLSNPTEIESFLISNGNTTQLPSPVGVTESHARDINERGQIIGYVKNRAAQYRLTIWEKGSFTLYPPMEGTQDCVGEVINNNNQGVGTCRLENNDIYGFLWENGTSVDINNILPQP